MLADTDIDHLVFLVQPQIRVVQWEIYQDSSIISEILRDLSLNKFELALYYDLGHGRLGLVTRSGEIILRPTTI